MKRRMPFALPVIWTLALAMLGALHVQLNRGGLSRALFSHERDRLGVGHLPVT